MVSLGHFGHLPILYFQITSKVWQVSEKEGRAPGTGGARVWWSPEGVTVPLKPALLH